MIAEELVQETFSRALSAKRKPSAFTEEHIRPWLFTIVRNHWFNEVRKRNRHAAEEVCDVELAGTETPETLLARRFLQSEVREAVDSLPSTYREVILLREIENFSYADMATLLECPVGTVMSRLARARMLLRQMLTRIASEHDSGVRP